MYNLKSTEKIKIQSSGHIYRYIHSAEIVEKISNYKLENKKSITQILTINGISFFDLFTSELACYHFPQAFLKKKSHYFLFHKIKFYLLNIFFSIKCIINSVLPKNKADYILPQKAIFLLSFTNRMYIDILHPLSIELNKNKNNSLVFLLEDNIQSAEDLNIRDAIYYNLLKGYNRKIYKETILLRNELKKAINQINIEKCVNDVLTDAEQEYLLFFTDLLKRFLNIYIPNIVKHVVIARNMLEKYNPTILISPDTADSKARIFAILAKKINIPYLEIQFGLAGDEAVEWKFSLANLIAVWGESSRQTIAKQLGSDEKLVITGSPRHDFLKNCNLTNTFRNLTGNKKIILLASTYHFKETNHVDISILKSMQLAISEAARINSNIFLIIKPHPHENVDETKDLFKSNSNSLFLDKNSDIRLAILNCDAFISYGSTSTIDAMIADKLVICPVFPGWDFSSDIFKNSGATLNPNNKIELFEIFNNINNDTFLEQYKNIFKKSRIFLKNYVYKSDGNGSKRIIDAIKNTFLLDI
jgi:hypothetical protein